MEQSVDSLKNRELIELMLRTHASMLDLIQVVSSSDKKDSKIKDLIEKMSECVNELFLKSKDLRKDECLYIQTSFEGKLVSLTSAKIGFIDFIQSFERKTGEKFTLRV
ncbi:hypothetical protein [Massilibacteroides sp.]|uniref:hypothetical protein n=1 Tax=Massilibacteroides sp. TaxID=2034766 RepID=UPI0026324A64|nr:hypothetical protein [Massilibacteroides sp.]MDD4515525.1 hypothetical protein [Massilibacteroides sp.]